MTDRDTPSQDAPDRRLPTIPGEEIARRGDAIYERDIRPHVGPDHDGEFVAIDVDSESWALGEALLDASDRLREKRPEAVNVWLLCVGRRYVAHTGWRGTFGSAKLQATAPAAHQQG
ncbi:MAG: hypothetical protein OXK21_04745 [Chloroflexota bacterium]|nr:hypothetical protein [Chloroflexota bacterium]